MRTRPIWRVLLPSLAALVLLPYVLLTTAVAEGDPEGALRMAPIRGGRHGGMLDRTFGTGGLVEESWPPLHGAHARTVIAQPDGKILLAGGDMDGARILRYDPDGSLDTTFGDAGSVTFGPEGSGMEGSVVAMALRSDGMIIVAGEVAGPNPSISSSYVTRLHPEGDLDTTFATSGFAVLGNPGSLADLKLQPDGKIVVGGRLYISGWQFYLARLNEDGTLDSGFGFTGGEIATGFPASVRAWVTSVLIQPDGKIVAVGNATNDIGIARYEPDGTLDPDFAVGGLLVSDIIRGPNWAGLQSDGSIVVAGSWRDIPYPYSDMAVTRFLPDGTLDTSFGEAGRTTIDFDEDNDTAAAGVIQDDGRIVVGGAAYLFRAGTSRRTVGLTRLDRNGRLDRQFGHGGIISIRLSYPELEAIALQPDGGILAAGTAVEGSGGSTWDTWFLARFLP